MNTKENLRKFHEMTTKKLFDRALLGYLTEEELSDKRIACLTCILNFALGDYEVGPPIEEGDTVICDMRLHTMNGIIMFRDNEVTAHT